jgi:antitoxin component HigA of HigAB toxin-antitoxin module
MEQVTIYRTSQGLEFDDPLQAQLAEDILAALDRFFEGSADRSLLRKVAQTRKAQSAPSVESSASLESLRNLKHAQKLTNRKLAAKAGISPGMLSDVLNQRVPLTTNMRQKLEAALKN